MARIHQRHFRLYSKRGPLSSALIQHDDGEIDQVSVFWNELGENPQNEEDAETLLGSMLEEIAAAADGAQQKQAAEALLAEPEKLMPRGAERRLTGAEFMRRARCAAFKKACTQRGVVRGVLNDPDTHPEWQKEIVRRRAGKIGWVPGEPGPE